MRPLDFLGRIKIKLGVVIVVAVVGAFATTELTKPLEWRYQIAGAVLVGLVLVYVLTRGMTRPLREMAAAARAMARGRYGLRVRATSRDEVGELARAFNAMAADLAEVDRQRRDLVANVSHELRTPIAGLRAVLENVVDGVAPADLETMRAALAQTERLGRLVSQLLDLSKLDSGAMPLEPERVSVADLFAQAVREAGLAGADIRADVPDGLEIRADPALLVQVLTNLIGNAVRHGPPDGKVVLSAESRRRNGAEGVRIVVADEGPGIPADRRETVFERFSEGGSGLGLAIVREIVELHGGTVRVGDGAVTGEPPRGCRILIDLPEEPPGGEPPMAPPGAVVPRTDREPPILPRPRLPMAPRWLLPAALGAGATAALTVPGGRPGLGVVLAGVAALTVVLPAAWSRLRADSWAAGFGVMACLLLAVALFRSAFWIVVPVLLAGFALASLAISGAGPGFAAVLRGCLSVISAVVPAPWFLAQPLGARRRRILSVIVGGLIAVGLVTFFGVLLATADEPFRDLAAGIFEPRWVLALAVAALIFMAVLVVLGAAVLVAVRPAAHPGPRPVRRQVARGVWVIPLAALNLLLFSFVALQVQALFEERTSGLAEYAREGFFQLLAVSGFVLALVAVAAWALPRDRAADRLLLAGLFGPLCGLTLVILASALYRLGLYTDDFGLSRMRALGGGAVGWIGVMLMLVIVAGVRMVRGRRSPWLPRTIVLVTGAAMFAFAAWNPDARVAESHAGRPPHRIDTRYLGDLSADAVPGIDRLPEPARSCALASQAGRYGGPDPWNTANLSRHEARRILRAQGRPRCP